LPDPSVATVAELDLLLGRGLLRMWTDDLAGARDDLSRLLTAGPERSAGFRVLAATGLGETEYRLGCWDDALVHCDLAVSIATDDDQPWVGNISHAIAAHVPAGRGNWDRATAHIEAAQRSPQPGDLAAISYIGAAAARLARTRGHPQAVIAALDPLLHFEHRDGVDEPGVVAWHDLLVDALVAIGDLDRAEAILGPFEAAATARGRCSAMAAAARARGTLEAARGNPEHAEIAFQAALTHASQVDLPFDHALLQLAYGVFLRRAGKRTLAAAQLRPARDTFNRLDALPGLQRCERELAACGLTPARRRQRDTARLTPQELAVARLVSGGLTNRQVARELVVSVKTVEYHLGHVYAKLKVASRIQLAHRFTQD
jgi:ATP/maltotriose-dependent transcriptional regulator MalT